MIFVSYSRADIDHVRAIVAGFVARGFECWIDESNIPVGQAFVERLGIALRRSDCFVLVDTPASRSSYWVSREVLTSSRYKREGRCHSMLRICSRECESTPALHWDLSVPIEQLATAQIAQFLTRRPNLVGIGEQGHDSEGVSIVNNTGLGQPSNWIGRQDELRALDDWWFGSRPGIWLTGLGGIGKSGLLQTWITALSHFGYGEAASVDAAYFRGSRITVGQVQRAFLTEKSSARSASKLLFVDGYDESNPRNNIDEAVLHALHRGVRVLVTGRRAVTHCLSEFFTTLELASITRRDSVTLLNQFGAPGPESLQLAAELGDHPLALVLASRSLAAGHRTAGETLASLRGVRAEQPDGCDRTLQSIHATLLSSFLRLTSDAKSLLMALCRDHRSTTAPAALKGSALSELASVGLVEVDHFEAARRLTIHPLVQKFVTELLAK